MTRWNKSHISLAFLLLVSCLWSQDLSQILDPDKVLSFADFLDEQKDYDRAITEYQRFLYLSPTCPKKNDIEFKIGLCYQKSGKYERAMEIFRKTSAIFEIGKTDGKKIPYKNPVVAGILSAVIPGSGRVYSNRIGDGLFSFILIVGSSSIAYSYYKEDKELPAYGLGIFSFLLYVGDIYGSVISAKLFNKHSREKHLNEMLNAKNK